MGQREKEMMRMMQTQMFPIWKEAKCYPETGDETKSRINILNIAVSLLMSNFRKQLQPVQTSSLSMS